MPKHSVEPQTQPGPRLHVAGFAGAFQLSVPIRPHGEEALDHMNLKSPCTRNAQCTPLRFCLEKSIATFVPLKGFVSPFSSSMDVGMRTAICSIGCRTKYSMPSRPTMRPLA